MKAAIFFVLAVWTLVTFSSCADLIQSLRDESAAIDDEEDRGRDPSGEEAYAYRKRTYNGLSANNVPSVSPQVTRGYSRRLASVSDEASEMASNAEKYVSPEFRRYTKQDFIDREASENSLWDGQGQSNYLFSHNRERQPGDLITADVEKELRREIQYQLWMTLPPEARRTKRTPASTKDGEKPKTPADAAAQAAKSAEEKAKDAAEEAAKTNLSSTGKDDDVVRMEVAETLGNGLVRVVGQKRVVYRGVSRVVEIGRAHV